MKKYTLNGSESFIRPEMAPANEIVTLNVLFETGPIGDPSRTLPVPHEKKAKP